MSTEKNILDKAKQSQLKEQISSYDSYIDGYKSKIDNCTQQINNINQSYNSLLLFKNSVQSSQDIFFSANGSKNGILQQVKSISDNTVAKKYYLGMEKILNGAGAKISTGLYIVLINSINAELKRLSNSVTEYENKISRYNSLISAAQYKRDESIRDLRKMEEDKIDS